jgi:hypothetical protein
MLVAVALTQVEFPAYYHELQRLENVPIVVIAVRNTLIATAFVASVVTLWRAPLAGTAEVAGKNAVSAQAEHPERLIGDDGGEHACQ